MLDFVPTNLGRLLLYLGQALHIVAVVLQSQLGSLRVTADAEVPSAFGHELDSFSCKTLLAQRRVFHPVLIFAFAVDLYLNVFPAFFFAQVDSDVGIGSFAMFEAEVRLPPYVLFVVLVFTVRLLGFSIARVFLSKATDKDHLIKILMCK